MRIFEIETLFKSGVTRTDFIETKNENEAWEKYDNACVLHELINMFEHTEFIIG